MPPENSLPSLSEQSRSVGTPQNLFLHLLDQCITDALIHFVVDGAYFIVGRARPAQAAEPGEVVVHVHRKRFFTRVMCEGNLGLGEAFMDGDFEVEGGALPDFLTILLRNRLNERIRRHPRLALKVLMTRVVNALRAKQRNVQHHYDLGDDLFEMFLDSTLTYSCGYANSPSDELELLQINKLDRICRKLNLQPGHHLLDIGCGYGGLLIFAAQHYQITGVGVTISRRHYEHGKNRIAEAGLSGQLRIEFQDYGTLRGEFDRVVSVGMLEHVPQGEYRRYFRSIARVLGPRGVGLVHSIGCNTFKNEHDPFIQKYIFPASNLPRLSEITSQLERNRLAILDVENIKPHYAWTVLAWLRRFRENQGRLDEGKYNAVFRRMWEYYFACGIAAARVSDSAVYQVLFTNDHTAEIPLQRV